MEILGLILRKAKRGSAKKITIKTKSFENNLLPSKNVYKFVVEHNY